jgi:hypothetical protein
MNKPLTYFRSFSLWVLLCWLPLAGQSQIVHDRVFGTATGQEELYTMTPLRAGGYLSVGSQSLPTPGPVPLYLLRQNAAGDTLWTKRWVIPGCDFYASFSCYAVEGATGDILVAGRSFTIAGTTQDNAFLALFNAQGDTLWTKRTMSLAPDWYSRPQLLPNGDYLVTGQLNNAPSLQRIMPTGQIIWQQYPVYAPGDNGTIGTLCPAGNTGSFWVTQGSGGGQGMFVQYDANGTRGVSHPFPAGLGYFGEITPYGNDYLVDAYPPINTQGTSSVMRLDASFNIVWKREIISGSRTFIPRRILALPNDNILVGSELLPNRLALHTLSPGGVILQDTTFLAPGALHLAGLAADPATGDYIFAGYNEYGPIGSADIFWTQWHHRVITATRAGQAIGQRWQAYPNPLATDGRLHLEAEQPLRGTLRLRDALGRQLTTWTAAGQLSQALMLPAPLPTGTYLLMLESHDQPPRTLRLVQP